MNRFPLFDSISFGGLLKTACLLSFMTSAARAQTPIIEYRFNEAGVTVVNTGSDGGAATFHKNASTTQDLHSSGGLGVSGASWDRAFLNTRAADGAGGAATSGSIVDAIDQQKSFTLMGWFNTGDANPIPGGARLISFDSATGGVSLWSNGSGDLNLTIDGSTRASTGALYNAANSWVFFAVTYDGSLTSNNVNFYVGTPTGLSAPLTLGLNKGTVEATDRALMIGNVAGYNRAFNGYLDNIRIFGSKTDASGVLTAPQIESFRALDVIPEPSSATLLILGGIGLSAQMLRSARNRP